MNHRLLRYSYMKLARELDLRFESLLLTGRVTKWYSEAGHEATAVAAGLALEPGDVLCSLHRDLGAILTVYLDPDRTFPGFGFDSEAQRPEPARVLYRLASQLLGRAAGFSEGIERSFHYAHIEPEMGIRHVGMISHLGAMVPVAAGCAWARRQDGTDRVALNFIGDGGTSTGDFHEGLNMAAVWKLPLILVIENNHYAFSTPAENQFAANRLSDRAAGYGIHGETVNGNDPDAMAAVMARAVRRARIGRGPTLIEARLGRLRGHSEGDDSLKVVPEEDLARYRAEDPVPAYAALLARDGALDPDLHQRLQERITELVESSIEDALQGAEPRPETAWRSVFFDPPEEPVEEPTEEPSSEPTKEATEGQPPGEPPEDPGEQPAEGVELTTYLDAIHHALRAEMELDPSVVLMGQDIGVFEGAFRVTRGLYARWPERVLDTPIAESGTLGIAVGAAMLGYRPVVEMQFADFVTCGFNQIVNLAAKLYYRLQIPCPLVIRLPSGGGVTAGPFHSQNPEGWFTHTAGLKVVCPATAADAGGLLRAAIRDPNPVIFCEHKFLYRRIKEELPAELPPLRLGEAAIRRAGRDVTLVGYGSSTWSCLQAAEVLAAEGVEAEVLDLRTLVPLDEAAVLDSVRRTGRVVVAHEAQLTGGFGAEVAARIAEGAFPWLDAPVRRVAYPDRPVPYAWVLEQELLPGADDIVAAARKVLSY